MKKNHVLCNRLSIKTLLLGVIIASVLNNQAFADTAFLGNGQILEHLFSAKNGNKTVTCAGMIKGKYASGKAVPFENSNLFIPLSEDLKTLKSKLKSSTSNSEKQKIQKKISKLNVKMKAENKICGYGPEGSPGTSPGTEPTPQPTPQATPKSQPTATPTPRAGNFDSAGNVTTAGKTKFGIPSNLSANRDTGKQIYLGSCAGCHEDENTGRSFSTYKVTIQSSPMFIFDKTDQDIANLTAYLRRFELN